MDGHSAVHGEGPEKLLGQLRIEIPDHRFREIRAEHEVGPPAKIDRGFRQGLVHRKDRVTETRQSLRAAHGLKKGLPKTDPDIFHCMVGVDFEVAFRFHAHIEAPVFREVGEHVIEKPDARRDFRLAAAIEIDGDLDSGLLRLTNDFCLSHWIQPGGRLAYF